MRLASIEGSTLDRIVAGITGTKCQFDPLGLTAKRNLLTLLALIHLDAAGFGNARNDGNESHRHMASFAFYVWRHAPGLGFCIH